MEVDGMTWHVVTLEDACVPEQLDLSVRHTRSAG